MQTRRRLHQTDQQDYNSSSTYTIQAGEDHHQTGPGAGAGSGGQGAASGSGGLLVQPLGYPPQQQASAEAAIHIGDAQSGAQSLAPDSDDKYGKAARQWNLRAFSGQALRTLSAAAAVVTGNNQPDTNFNSQNNYNYNSTSVPTSGQLSQEEQFDQEPEPEVFIMAARDRTGEFANAIRSLQARNITRAVNIRDPRKAKQVQSYSEFMMVARFIGKNIASTYAKLEKLTMRK